MPVSGIAIGIAGFGKIARDQHLPAIEASDTFRLVALTDPVAAGPGLPNFPDLGEMLSVHPEIEAVSLCMPPRFRAGAARAALAAGRHVFLEKPPCTTMTEALELKTTAEDAGVTNFTAWHSQFASGVDPARIWLAGKAIRSVKVTWKEDVRVWHPGQRWIWQEGGFGVFDPGINALSILTSVLPGELRVAEAQLFVPANCATPIAANLIIGSAEGFEVKADFDFLQTGPQSWDIEVVTDDGTLLLSHGGNRLAINGEEQAVAPEGEYLALYTRFAELIRTGRSQVDLAPLALTEQALATGQVTSVEPFEE